MDIPCVGAIILDGEGRLLVVRRGRPPNAGLWSIPGGRAEAGETAEDAVRREVLEETGLEVEVLGRVGSVVLAAASASDRYLVTDFAAVVVPGTPTQPVPGDDAADARWTSYDDFHALELTPGLAASLQRWGVWAEHSG